MKNLSIAFFALAGLLPQSGFLFKTPQYKISIEVKIKGTALTVPL